MGKGKKHPILDKEYNMSVEMVHKEINLSVTYIRQLTRQGAIVAKKIRSRWHYRMADIEKFLEGAK